MGDWADVLAEQADRLERAAFRRKYVRDPEFGETLPSDAPVFGELMPDIRLDEEG